MEHDNVRKAREGYEAFGAGDMEAVSEYLADDVVWHAANQGELSGDYKGKEEVFNYFGKLIQETGGSFKIDVEDILGNDNRVVVLGSISGTRNGKSLTQRGVFVHSINDQGQTSEFWGFPEDQRKAEEFWS